MTKAADLSALGSNVTTSGNLSSASTLSLQTNSTTAVTINSSQNVGIGTTTPSALLNISGSSATSVLSAFTIVNTESGAGVSITGTGTTFSNAGWITVTDAAYIRSAGASSNGMILHTPTGPLMFATGSAEAMRIDSSGNVGINKNNPSFKLDLYGGAMRIDNGSSAGTVYFVDTNAYINYSSSTMQFAVNGAERMRINSVGSRLYANFSDNAINTGEATITWGNVSSTTFDISTLFSGVGGLSSGVSINIQVQTWTGASNTGTSVIGNGARANSSWAWTTINNTNTGGGPTVTFSASGNIVTISFSFGGQYGKAKISLIATS